MSLCYDLCFIKISNIPSKNVYNIFKEKQKFSLNIFYSKFQDTYMYLHCDGTDSLQKKIYIFIVRVKQYWTYELRKLYNLDI